MKAPADTRVLIVDDEPMMCELLKELLSDADFQVIAQASNGRSAIEKAESLKPDVICLDINMPEVDGLDALASIKTTNKDIIVIMVTANSSSSNVQQAIRTGADGYILKPFKRQQIIDAIRKAQMRRAG